MVARNCRICLVVLALVALAGVGIASTAAADSVPAQLTATSQPTVTATEIAGYQRDFAVDAATATAHLELQARGRPMVDAVRTAQGDDYAGVWFDNQEGRFKVGMVPGADPAPVQAILAADDLTDETDLVPVDNTWSQLQAAESGLLRSTSDLMAQRKARVGIDPTTNSVLIEVADGVSDATVSALTPGGTRAAASSDDVNVEVRRKPAAALAVQTTACSAPDCDRPLRGGVRIQNTVDGCSMGALTTRGGSYYIMTAGHCVRTGGTWTAFTSAGTPEDIGSAGGWLFDGTYGDIGAINVSSSSYWIYAGWVPETAAWNVDLDHGTTGSAYSYVGEFTCHFGQSTLNPLSGAACGTTTAVSTYGNYAPSSYVGPLSENTACVLPGDSGGTVEDGNTVVGIVSGGSFGGTGPYYCISGGVMLYEEAPSGAAWLGGLTIATIF